MKTADRGARRTIGGTGGVQHRSRFDVITELVAGSGPSSGLWPGRRRVPRALVNEYIVSDISADSFGNRARLEPGSPDLPPASQLFAPGRKSPEPAPIQAKLRRLLNAITDLNAETWREGPHTILERYLELTGTVLDLLGANTPDAHRAVANIGSFLRFAADWQKAHLKGTLGDFVDYLDAYQ